MLIFQVLKLMVEQKSRPLDFLKQISARLLAEDSLNIKECSDILYGLSALHYHDEVCSKFFTSYLFIFCYILNVIFSPSGPAFKINR